MSCLKYQSLNSYEILFNVGDKGDNFYIVAEGELKVTRQEQEGEAAKDCGTYTVGDYFGELAFVHNIPSDMNVIAEVL